MIVIEIDWKLLCMYLSRDACLDAQFSVLCALRKKRPALLLQHENMNFDRNGLELILKLHTQCIILDKSSHLQDDNKGFASYRGNDIITWNLYLSRVMSPLYTRTVPSANPTAMWVRFSIRVRQDTWVKIYWHLMIRGPVFFHRAP